jgi:hypothetical protein
MLIVYIVIFLFGLYELFSSLKIQLFEANILMVSNLVVIICLILGRYNIWKTEQGSLMEVAMEIEDIHQVTLERKAYIAATYIQIALSISFIALLVGFLLLRDTQPEIVLASGILMVFSFASLFPSEKIVSITNPNFKFPDPQSKNYNEEYFEQFDDGEKYVMLKGLYKLYAFVIWGLVILAFGLMYYSVFTGDSQLVSIIGIGVLLMLVQVSYTMSLKPSKLK